jgi:hypothetical protein
MSSRSDFKINPRDVRLPPEYFTEEDTGNTSGEHPETYFSSIPELGATQQVSHILYYNLYYYSIVPLPWVVMDSAASICRLSMNR